MVAAPQTGITLVAAAPAADAKQLDARSKAQLLAAMLGVLGLSIGLLLIALLVMRAARRLVREERPADRGSLPDPDDWARKSLADNDVPDGQEHGREHD